MPMSSQLCQRLHHAFAIPAGSNRRQPGKAGCTAAVGGRPPAALPLPPHRRQLPTLTMPTPWLQAPWPRPTSTSAATPASPACSPPMHASRPSSAAWPTGRTHRRQPASRTPAGCAMPSSGCAARPCSTCRPCTPATQALAHARRPLLWALALLAVPLVHREGRQAGQRSKSTCSVSHAGLLRHGPPHNRLALAARDWW